MKMPDQTPAREIVLNGIAASPGIAIGRVYLFTKEIPRGVFELMMPGLRWTLRGNAYSYFMADEYPPFVWG